MTHSASTTLDRHGQSDQGGVWAQGLRPAEQVELIIGKLTSGVQIMRQEGFRKEEHVLAMPL